MTSTMIKQPSVWSRLLGCLLLASPLALISPPAGATATHVACQPSSSSGNRPTALPLLAGATDGGVFGGTGDRVLFGSETIGGLRHPVRWNRCHGGWSVTDLSRGGQLAGDASGADGRGDILITGASRGWVLTPDGNAHELAAPAGYPGGVYARQINERGQIAGGVFGTGPEFLSTAALWTDYRSLPRLYPPLPFDHSIDSIFLGLNDRGSAVGNSNSADFSDFAGGYWRKERPVGTLLPGIDGGHHSFPLRINDRGLVVGEAISIDTTRDGAAVWRDGRLVFVGTATPTDTSGTFFGVSDNGRAVGVSFGADVSSRCIYWRHGHALAVLPPLAGTTSTGQANAHYVSESGLVGGDSSDASGADVPVVWADADRQAVVLGGR